MFNVKNLVLEVKIFAYMYKLKIKGNKIHLYKQCTQCTYK